MLSLSKTSWFSPLFVFLQTAFVQSLSPPPSTSNTTTYIGTPNTLGINCLTTLTRFERPPVDDCALALTNMPSDPTQQSFRLGEQLPFYATGGSCIVTIAAPRGSPPVPTSWLYLQTASTQLMIGCLRTYNQFAVRTGGTIRVGKVGAFLEIYLNKRSGNALQHGKNGTIDDVEGPLNEFKN